MKKIYDAVATIGEYKNKQGETKKNFLNVGTVFENDKGAISLKLNAIPVSFSGWINFYVPKEKESADSEPQSRDKFKEAAAQEFDSDLPF